MSESNSNLSPEEKENLAAEKAKNELAAAAKKQDAERKRLENQGKNYWSNVKRYAKRLLSLKEGVDHEGTGEGIKHDVEFRGHAAWILVCSILIASLGLNVNSPAVIIGAMLISPLMGPILGVGYAAGTHDWELLTKSLKNFGVTIIISLIISVLYFYVSPIKSLNLELESRTSATIYAIAIAFVGGAAGIIAGSRPLKNNVVPGVAIATALMPPLCTAGYGIAIWNWQYFFGAFYLFFINSIFIALPTYLYIRYLKFPVKEFVDPNREKRIKRYILMFLILVIVPSGYSFYNLIQDNIAQRNMESYLAELNNELDNYNHFIDIKSYASKDSLGCIVNISGEPAIPSSALKRMGTLALNFDIPTENIVFKQIDLDSLLRRRNEREDALMTEQDDYIGKLEREIKHLRTNFEKRADLDVLHLDVNDEVSYLFPELELHYFLNHEYNSLETFLYKWNKETSESDKQELDTKLRNWLPNRLEADSIDFIIVE